MALAEKASSEPPAAGSGKRRILSGMRPTGRLHLGNYYGALYNWVKLQEHYRCYYFVADWHAITTEYEAPQAISRFIPEMIIDWLSAGLDPKKSTLFVQSAIPEHAELYLIFGMFTPVPWLERNPTYKDQIEALAHKDLTTYGFLGYPVLQAADILMYKAEGVPVGVDQVPHVEMTREIARRFNHLYRPIFPEPEALLTEIPKLTGTDGRKMSKSYDNCIYLSDPPEEMARKVRQMTTDTLRPFRRDPGEPDRCLAFPFHRLNLPKERLAEIIEDCRGAALGCVDCKKLLAEALLENMVPLQERRRHFEAHPDEVRDILAEGNKRARGTGQRNHGRSARGHRLQPAVSKRQKLRGKRQKRPISFILALDSASSRVSAVHPVFISHRRGASTQRNRICFLLLQFPFLLFTFYFCLMSEERLQKFLSRAGVASRRAAEELIRAGRVRVNGRVVTEMGTKVDPAREVVLLDNRPVSAAAPPLTVVLHKPYGYICTRRDPQGRRLVMDLLPEDLRGRLYPVGRLDYDATGLLLLSSDGELAHRLTPPATRCPAATG